MGYSIDSRMKAALAVSALRNAISLRSPEGTIVHSDRGSQFRSKKFVRTLIQRLVDAEILAPLTQSKRNQVWGAVDILDELEDLSTRIEIAARLT